MASTIPDTGHTDENNTDKVLYSGVHFRMVNTHTHTHPYPLATSTISPILLDIFYQCTKYLTSLNKHQASKNLSSDLLFPSHYHPIFLLPNLENFFKEQSILTSPPVISTHYNQVPLFHPTKLLMSMLPH